MHLGASELVRIGMSELLLPQHHPNTTCSFSQPSPIWFLPKRHRYAILVNHTILGSDNPLEVPREAFPDVSLCI